MNKTIYLYLIVTVCVLSACGTSEDDDVVDNENPCAGEGGEAIQPPYEGTYYTSFKSEDSDSLFIRKNCQWDELITVSLTTGGCYSEICYWVVDWEVDQDDGTEYESPGFEQIGDTLIVEADNGTVVVFPDTEGRLEMLVDGKYTYTLIPEEDSLNYAIQYCDPALYNPDM